MQTQLQGAQRIIDSSNDAIVTNDMNGIITSWSAGAERVFGYTRDEMLGRSVLKLFPAGDEAKEAALLAQLRQGLDVPTDEAERIKKNGDRITVSITLSPLRDGMGTVRPGKRVPTNWPTD